MTIETIQSPLHAKESPTGDNSGERNIAIDSDNMRKKHCHWFGQLIKEIK